MATTAEQLASVQAAIAAIEGGAQSYETQTLKVSKADLATLYNREEALLKRLQRQNSGGSFSLATIRGPR